MKTVTHRPFLRQIIECLHEQMPYTWTQSLFIFPTQLSIDYFQTLLNEQKWKQALKPTSLTLHQFILMHSKIKEASTLDLLQELHTVADQILNRKTPFEQFYSWGTTLLQDFNCLDKYLINSSALFLALMRQKQLTVAVTSPSFLDQNQSDAFKNAMDLSLFQQKENALFWEKLPLLYQVFTKKLIQQGKGYEGLCYRIASKRALSETITAEKKIIFVGFNLLSPAEERFITQCKAVAPVEFFWDVDPHYLDNEINVAGNYLRQHRKKKYFQASFPKAYETYFNDINKKIIVTEMHAAVDQVHAIINTLQEKTDEGKPKLLPVQTAIVVSGTDLLMPLFDKLASLPIPLHCRIPYSVGATVVYTLIEGLVEVWMQCISKETEVKDEIYRSLVLLRSLVGSTMQTKITSLLQGLKETPSDFKSLKHQLGSFALWLNDKNKHLFAYLQEVLAFIDNHFTHAHKLFLDLNRTALQYALEYIEPLTVIDCAQDSGFIPLFLKGLKESTMLFHQDNPLTGLYIIEVAESHNLDFEHVFFMNISEGYFPMPSYHDSFLPHNICNSFGLPLTDKTTESTTAYGFYRLLQRSQQVHCSYVKQNNFGSSSEMSRLLLQLSFDSELKIVQRYLPFNFSELLTPVISIEKDGVVMQLLEKFLVKETSIPSSITATALVRYLRCPLQFYFTYLLQLKQTILPKEREGAIQLGILFHHIMERLYQPFVGIKIDKPTIAHLKSKIKTEVKELVATQLPKLNNYEYALRTGLLEKLLERMLELDDAATPFTLLGTEVGKKEPIATTLYLDKQRKVLLSGIIDRVDVQGNIVRIIDYKTGASCCKISSIETLFDRTKIKKNKAVFQLMFYAWLFKSTYKEVNQKYIMPYLVNIKDLFLDAYTPGIFIQQPGNTSKYEQIKDIIHYESAFKEGLLGILLEIFDPAIPFMQTEDLEECAYCPYVAICQR